MPRVYKMSLVEYEKGEDATVILERFGEVAASVVYSAIYDMVENEVIISVWDRAP